eukprot:1118618-Rhodomonas_salina.1
MLQVWHGWQGSDRPSVCRRPASVRPGFDDEPLVVGVDQGPEENGVPQHLLLGPLRAVLAQVQLLPGGRESALSNPAHGCLRP